MVHGSLDVLAIGFVLNKIAIARGEHRVSDFARDSTAFQAKVGVDGYK